MILIRADRLSNRTRHLRHADGQGQGDLGSKGQHCGDACCRFLQWDQLHHEQSWCWKYWWWYVSSSRWVSSHHQVQRQQWVVHPLQPPQQHGGPPPWGGDWGSRPASWYRVV